MIRCERRRTPKEFTAGVFVRFGNFGEFLEAGTFQKIAQMAEGILIGHEINAEFTTARIEPANFRAGQSAPALPNGFVTAIGERMFSVELQLVDFEIGEMLSKIEQRFQFRHASARDVEHHAAARKIRPVADFQTGQLTAVLMQQLSQSGDGGAQSRCFPEFDLYPALINRQYITFRVIRRGFAADDADVYRAPIPDPPRFSLKSYHAGPEAGAPILQALGDHRCDFR